MRTLGLALIFMLVCLFPTTESASNCKTSPRKTVADRMHAAQLHFEASCILTSIYICSKFDEPKKFECYEKMNAKCPVAAADYRRWLEQGQPSEEPAC